MSISALFSNYSSSSAFSLMSDPTQYSAALSASALSAYSLLPLTVHGNQPNFTAPLPNLRSCSFSIVDPNVNTSSASNIPQILSEPNPMEQLFPSMFQPQLPLRQNSQTPFHSILPSEVPSITAIDSSSSSSWSSESSPSDEWLPTLPALQSPRTSTSSISESASTSASASSPSPSPPPISFSASFFGQSATTDGIHSKFSSESNTAAVSFPAAHGELATISFTHSIAASSAPSSLSSTSSASTSISSFPPPLPHPLPLPNPITLHSTSTCSTASASSSHSSPLSPGASFEEASSARRAKSRRQMNWRARLEAQQKYDRKRRSTIRVLFESLRNILKSAQLITEEVEAKTEDTKQSSAPCDGKVEGENNLRAVKKKSKKRPKERTFDDFSTIDLVNAASGAIRHLNEMKEKLEKQLEETKYEDVMIEATMDPNELEREAYYCKEEEMEDQKRRHRYTNMIDSEENEEQQDEQQTTPSKELVLSSFSSSSRVGFSKPFQWNSPNQFHLNEMQSLLHAIQVLNRQYTAEIEAVREMENKLPKEVSDLTHYFGGSFGILGLDGRIAMVLKVHSNHPRKSEFDRYFNTQYHAAHAQFRAPHILQLHCLTYVLSSGFHYQEEDEEDLKAKDDAEAFHNNLKKHVNADEFCDSDDDAEQRNQKWSTAQIMQFLSNGMNRCSQKDSTVADDYRSHPLGRYALPPESFALVQQVLTYLAQLSEEEYDRQWAQLSGIAAEIFPFPLYGWRIPATALKHAVFNPISKVSHSELVSFYELYCGIKPMVSLKKRKMFMNGELRYLDWDVMLIKHPQSGLPLAHLTIPRDIYTDDELQLLEFKFRNNCPPELKEMIKMHQNLVKKPAPNSDTSQSWDHLHRGVTSTNPTW